MKKNEPFEGSQQGQLREQVLELEEVEPAFAVEHVAEELVVAAVAGLVDVGQGLDLGLDHDEEEEHYLDKEPYNPVD